MALETFALSALNALFWPVTQLSVAALFVRLPLPAAPAVEGAKAQERALEGVFAVRRWKDLLPDGARMIGYGFSKRHLRSSRSADLREYARECVRGERAHACMLACGLIPALYNPPWAAAVMFMAGAFLNLPCLVSQRYNRLRIARMLAARG